MDMDIAPVWAWAEHGSHYWIDMLLMPIFISSRVPNGLIQLDKMVSIIIIILSSSTFYIQQRSRLELNEWKN